MTIDAIIIKIRADLDAAKDGVLERIVNGTFKSPSAADTGMAYASQQSLLLGLHRAGEIIDAAIKHFTNPKSEGNGDAGVTEQPAGEVARPKY